MTDRSPSFIWVFTNGGLFPGGIFNKVGSAEKWIHRHRWSGVLTRYPVDEGCFDWALRCGHIDMKPEQLDIKRADPHFIGGFSTALQEHRHYEDGANCDPDDAS